MRVCTYIAADFDHDKNAVDYLYNLKRNKYITFNDAHELQQSSDLSLPCSIKKSLKYRMDNSNKFILIVGEHTNTVSKGGCQLCDRYNSYTSCCSHGYSVDTRSFIRYECDIALEAVSEGLTIVVLYYDYLVNRNLCLESVRWKGVHQQMLYLGIDGNFYWDYFSIKHLIGG